MQHALLVAPSANRVYSGSAVEITVAELTWFAARALNAEVTDIGPVTLGNVAYVGFSGDPLDERDLRLLSNLSSVHAVFAREGELLRPLAVTPRARYPDDLVTVQRYVGKTNEAFTKLLVNLAVLAGPAPDALDTGALDGRRVALFDPLCGRGTTLNHALRYGFDATGIDADRGDFDAYTAFLKTWLRTHRYKHKADVHPLRHQKETLGRRFTAEIGVDKEAYKAGDVDRLTVVQADTRVARAFLARGSFDVLATDAPYGVQHGSQGRGAGGERLSRRPDELLDEALPVWHELLRPGGSLSLAWNTLVDPREQMVARLAKHGFGVLDHGVSFTHRVDQAIVRDVVVATRVG